MGLTNINTWMKQKGVVTEHASFCYQTTGAIPLNIAPVQATSFQECGIVENVTESNGVFTALVGGRYLWNLERVYKNTDHNISSEITLYLDVKKGNDIVIARELPLSEAKSAQNPSGATLTSSYVLDVEAGDTFTFWVHAIDGASNPASTTNELIQVTGHKIKEI